MQAAKLTAYWYTPESEEVAVRLAKKESKIYKPTRFKLQPIDQATFFEINQDCEVQVNGKGETVVMPSPSAAKEILTLGVVGWEKLMNGKKAIKFEENKKLSLIPYFAQVELCNEIFNASSISEAQTKNS